MQVSYLRDNKKWHCYFSDKMHQKFDLRSAILNINYGCFGTILFQLDLQGVPIFYTILFLFVYIVKPKQTKKFADSIQKFCGFSKFYKNLILFEANFWNFDYSYPFLGSCKVPHKIRNGRYDVYWIHTETLTAHYYCPSPYNI